MAESHVVSALISKRAEIAGPIARTQQQLGQFRADLAHLDATIRLFAPAMEPEMIPAKRICQSDLLFERLRISVEEQAMAPSSTLHDAINAIPACFSEHMNSALPVGYTTRELMQDGALGCQGPTVQHCGSMVRRPREHSAEPAGFPVSTARWRRPDPDRR